MSRSASTSIVRSLNSVNAFPSSTPHRTCRKMTGPPELFQRTSAAQASRRGARARPERRHVTTSMTRLIWLPLATMAAVLYAAPSAEAAAASCIEGRSAYHLRVASRELSKSVNLS